MRTASLVACLLSSVCAVAQERPAAPVRADLVIPENVWADALGAVRQAGPALGYGGDVMRNYRYDAHRLRTVEGLFTDVRAVPRFSRFHSRLPKKCTRSFRIGPPMDPKINITIGIKRVPIGSVCATGFSVILPRRRAVSSPNL